MNTVPTGFHGVLSSSARVAGVHAASSASTVRWKRPSVRVLLHGTARRARQTDRRLIGVVDRIGNQDLVPGSSSVMSGCVDAESRPVGDQDLGGRIISQAVVPRSLSATASRSRLAAIVRIRRSSGLSSARCAASTMCGGVAKVGLAAHQRDELPPLRLQRADLGQDRVDRGRFQQRCTRSGFSRHDICP